MRKPSEPSYRLHKSSGQAVTWIQGKTFYLGPYDSQESKQKYHKLLAKFHANPNSFGVEKCRLSIAEVAVLFLKHCREYYKDSPEFPQYARALGPVIELFSDSHINEFGISEFKVVRDYWVRRGCARSYCNKNAKRVVAFFKWLVSEDLLDVTVYQTLKTVPPLKAGRCSSPEAPKVRPVDDATITATIKHLPKVLADMVRIHRLLGCRPSELLCIKPCMVDTKSEVWTIKLEKHKNAWRGHDRVLVIGPKAKQLLRPYLNRPAEAYCFSPAEAMEQRLADREAARTTALSCGNRRGSNRKANPKKKPGDFYTVIGYTKAIHTAARKAGLPIWGANRLRHATATAIRAEENLEAASAILGHRTISMTENYAERSLQRAIEVAK
jgi:integrase